MGCCKFKICDNPFYVNKIDKLVNKKDYLPQFNCLSKSTMLKSCYILKMEKGEELMKGSIIKRIVSICMVLVLFLGTCSSLSGCTNQDKTTNNTENTPMTGITKAEWITGLASTFGLTDYKETNPYFSDVDASSEIFAYVQSCAEWGLFEETGGTFDADTVATREFIIASAVIAAESLKPTGENQYPTYEECITYAVTENLLSNSDAEYLAAGVEMEEAQSILNWAQDTYMYQDLELHENIVFKETVKGFSNAEVPITIVDGMITMDNTTGATLMVGDIIITPPTAEDPVGVARKIVAITTDEQGNFVFTTEQPELGEVFSELSYAATVVPTMEHLFLNEGVTVADIDTDAFRLVKKEQSEEKNGFSTTLNVSFSSKDGFSTGAKVKENEDELSLKLSQSGLTIEEQADALTKLKFANINYDEEKQELKEDDTKFEGGYSITGSITIRDLYADIELDLKKVIGIPYGVDSLSIIMNYEIEPSLTLEGSFEGEFNIGKFIVPVAGVSALEFDVILSIDAKGVITVRLVNGNFIKLSYQDGDFKKTIRETNDKEVSLKADIGMDAALNTALEVLGICIIDLEAKAGADFTFSTGVKTKEKVLNESEEKITKEKEGLAYLKASYVFPVVTLEVGNNKDALLNVEKKWELIGKKGEIKKIESKDLYNEEFLLFRIEEVEWLGLVTLNDEAERALVEFVNAPVNARITYDNLFATSGVQEFIQRQAFLDKENLDSYQQYIAGTDIWYSEEDRVFADGHVEKGAELMFQTQEEERFDRDYTILRYSETELQWIRTDRAHTDTRNASIVGNVGGFSDFLREHGCRTVNDMVEALGLGSDFRSMAALTEADYVAEFNTKEYGKVTIYLECEEGWNIDLKALSIRFEEGSSSPYRKIDIYQKYANTMTAYIPILRVEAYAWNY